MDKQEELYLKTKLFFQYYLVPVDEGRGPWTVFYSTVKCHLTLLLHVELMGSGYQGSRFWKMVKLTHIKYYLVG